ncbi:hypothetical protein EV421DRAFT_1742595 [Armillaria borealis]|uniref:Uncharacterized protein n=1 Tax=Armillaria borealis TaxID=47425 RepID=A0AA39MEM9_9AGAR|nr:hypothetical protein EV421DRAFT_1742595 [Armillaria borealis]
MPPLLLLLPTPMPTQDTFTPAADTLLSNLTTLQGPPHLVILLAPSRPLIDMSITISTPIYAGFHLTMTLESLHPYVCRLRFTFKSVSKRTEEKTLHSAIIVCPDIEELEVDGEAGEECWCSIVPHFKILLVLIMRKPGTAQVKTMKEELDERFPSPKTCQNTLDIVYYQPFRPLHGHQRMSSSSQLHWRHPSPSLPHSRSSPCPPFDDVFMKKIARDFAPPLPRIVIPLMEQRFMKAEQCFGFNNSDDNNDLPFFTLSATRQSSSMQHCHEEVEVDVHGAGKMVMVSV